MYGSQFELRGLWDALHSYRGKMIDAELLQPWLVGHREEAAWFKAFGARTGHPIPNADNEDLCRLYAFGRCIEVLMMGFQPGGRGQGDWSGPPIELDEFVAFAAAFGIRAVEQPKYSPFHHELVEVLQSRDESTPPRLLRTRWPCLMLGPMMFIRAGVTVDAGRCAMVAGAADLSRLYWAHRRRYRPTFDMSDGWGSNSQWRTEMRRDYEFADALYFNVDGRVDLSKVPRDHQEDWLPTVPERYELLMNRCFVSRPDGKVLEHPFDDMLRLEKIDDG